MFKAGLIVLGSLVLVIALAGCNGSSVDTSGGNAEGAAALPPGIEPNKVPDAGQIPTRERPGSNLSKTNSGGDSGN